MPIVLLLLLLHPCYDQPHTLVVRVRFLIVSETTLCLNNQLCGLVDFFLKWTGTCGDITQHTVAAKTRNEGKKSKGRESRSDKWVEEFVYKRADARSATRILEASRSARGRGGAPGRGCSGAGGAHLMARCQLCRRVSRYSWPFFLAGAGFSGGWWLSWRMHLGFDFDGR